MDLLNGSLEWLSWMEFLQSKFENVVAKILALAGLTSVIGGIKRRYQITDGGCLVRGHRSLYCQRFLRSKSPSTILIMKRDKVPHFDKIYSVAQCNFTHVESLHTCAMLLIDWCCSIINVRCWRVFNLALGHSHSIGWTLMINSGTVGKWGINSLPSLGANCHVQNF